MRSRRVFFIGFFFYIPLKVREGCLNYDISLSHAACLEHQIATSGNTIAECSSISHYAEYKITGSKIA